MRPARLILLAGALTGATAAGLALWSPAEESDRNVPAPLAATGNGAEPRLPANDSGKGSTAPGKLPSHVGTDLDGAVRLDPDGQVVTNRQLRRLFEYFLTGLGKAPPEALKARLRAAVEARGLPADAVEQVMALFDRYLGYREALGELERPGTSTASLRQAFEARYQLRREIFGAAAAEGLFGREEAIDRYALEKREIMGNERLTPAQRQRRLALIEQQLPADVREARRRTRVAVSLRERTEEQRASGASAAEIHALREEMVGPEAAQRLAALESRREQWQRRLAAYRQARQRIVNSEGLAPEDRQAAIERLLAEHFDAHEARRVRALQRLNDDG